MTQRWAGDVLVMTVCLMSVAACGKPKFPGTYALAAVAKPGTHTPSASVPRGLRGAMLTLRDDGSASLGLGGSDNEDGKYRVTADTAAVITSGGSEAMLARFSHDTLVTRVPGGGPVLYWRRTQ